MIFSQQTVAIERDDSEVSFLKNDKNVMGVIYGVTTTGLEPNPCFCESAINKVRQKC